MCNLFCFIRYASERRDDTCNPNIPLFAQPACEPRVNAGAPRPPRNCRKWSFQGGGGACRGGGGGGGTAKVAREPPGESTQMRAGGATEAIWVDSARRSRGFARGCGRERVPLMYSTAAPGGGGTTKMRPSYRRDPFAKEAQNGSLQGPNRVFVLSLNMCH